MYLSEICERGRGRFLTKTDFFTATFLVNSNNSATKFYLHLQFFLHMPHC